MGELGAPGPTLVEAMPPDGHWLVACQARRDTDGDGKIEVSLGRHGDVDGDALEPFFIDTAGPGVPIDAFVDADARGRHLAFVRGGVLTLHDSWRRRDVELTHADRRDDDNPFGTHRAASFDAQGTRVAYARIDGEAPRIVVREIDGGMEHVIDPGEGTLVRFSLDPSGSHVWIWMLAADTNGDGRLELPRPKTSLAARGCRGPVDVYGNYGLAGDAPSLRIAPVLDDATALDEPGALGVLDGALIVRASTGAIVRRGPNADHELVPGKCDPVLMHVEPSAGSMFFVCRRGAKLESNGWFEAPLMRHDRAGKTEPVGITVQNLGHDEWADDDGLLFGDDKYFNPATGTIGPAISGPPYHRVGDKLLYLPNAGPIIYDLGAGKRRPWRVPLEAGTPNVARGDLFAAVDDAAVTTVVDLAREIVVGQVKGAPIAMTPAGHVLVARGGSPRGVLQGPLQWLTPE